MRDRLTCLLIGGSAVALGMFIGGTMFALAVLVADLVLHH